MSRRRRLRGLTFVLLPGLLLFGAAELTLRLSGFQYASTPLEAAFLDRPDGVVERELGFRNRQGALRLVKDPHQLWVPRPSPLDGRTPGRRPGVLRIATLGDSCTAHCVGALESFPALLERELDPEARGRIEVLNAGVASHSSYQGLQRLRHEVLPFEPDWLTVSYGWNDHWIAAVPDRAVRLRSAWETALVNALERSRLYQGLHFAIASLRSRARPAPADPRAAPVLRVPPAEYRENLIALVELARAHGARVLLLTAPQEIPADWNEAKLLPLPAERVAALHERYNEVVREVARERRVELLDLAAAVARMPPGSVLARDGIHFHAQGCRFVARMLLAKLRELGVE